MRPTNEAILKLLAERGPKGSKALALHPQAARTILAQYQGHEEATHLLDSEGAAEQATLDNRQMDAAGRTWAALTPEERSVYTKMSPHAGELTETLLLASPV